MFGGLHAFPLTPMPDDVLDEPALIGLIERLAAAGVDAITVLGSTGSYAYLTAAERARVVELAVAHAGTTPVIAGVGALRTSQVLRHLADAEAAGASGVLLAPMAYQPLASREVLGLYRTVTAATDLPVMVYDNPTTTHVEFSLELYGEIAALPGTAAIKIPPVPLEPEQARQRVAAVRAAIPEHVEVGISGDQAALAGLRAGCDTWCSVIGGTLPEPALEITRAAQAGRWEDARAAADRLAPVWELFAACGGSLRGTVALAEQLSLVPGNSLPAPLQGPDAAARRRAAEVVEACGLAGEGLG